MSTLSASCANVFLRLTQLTSTRSAKLAALYASIERNVARSTRVEIMEVANLIAQLTHDSENPDIGLHAYDVFHPGQLNTQLYSIMSSATLGDALHSLAHFSSLLSDGALLYISESNEGFSIHFLRLESLGVDRQYVDCCMSTVLGTVHWLLPFEKPAPLAVAFSYREPHDRTRLQNLFGEHPRFSSATNSLTFSVQDWNRPLATANPALKTHHDNYLHAELAKTSAGLSSCVKNHILIALVSGSMTSLEAVAHTLNLSARALQNRLDEASTGFRDLLDECRKQLATHWLRFTDDTIKLISQRLGFSEPSSFHRACKRWYGCPPSAYRSRHVTAPAIA